MTTEKLYTYVKGLCVIGIGLALYLLWQRYGSPSIQPCSINATINCNALISGPLKDTFGIPTAAIGLTGYILILIGAIKKLPKLIIGMASFGLVFCLWLGDQELFILKVICPVCIMCQIVMLSVFGLSWKLNKQKAT